jgi:hypothetical protein
LLHFAQKRANGAIIEQAPKGHVKRRGRLIAADSFMCAPAAPYASGWRLHTCHHEIAQEPEAHGRVSERWSALSADHLPGKTPFRRILVLRGSLIRSSGGSDVVATSLLTAGQHFPGRRLLLVGLALAVLGVVAYLLQLALGRLVTPWYMPALASLGALCAIMSLVNRRTAWRIVALSALLLLAGAEWAMLFALRLPSYSGPIVAGRPFPRFETIRADGTPFGQTELTGRENNVLVFFRGRW